MEGSRLRERTTRMSEKYNNYLICKRNMQYYRRDGSINIGKVGGLQRFIVRFNGRCVVPKGDQLGCGVLKHGDEASSSL